MFLPDYCGEGNILIMDMIQTMKDVVSIESVTNRGEGGYPYGSGVAKALDYMLAKAEELGFRTVNPDYAYGYAEIGEGEEIIGVLGHLDVVPAGDGWNTPPYEATEIDGKIYGRGTVDDKGPMVAAMYAVKDLVDSGAKLNKRIRFIFGQTEEAGDWNDIEDYIANEELPTCGFTPDAEFPALYGEKGIFFFDVEMPHEMSGLDDACAGSVPNIVPDKCKLVIDGKVFEATGVPAHGSMPWKGENAITNACKAAVEAGAKSAFVDMFMETFADSHHGVKTGVAFEDVESGKISVNPGVLKIEDGKVILTVDTRRPVTFTAEQELAALKERFEPFGVTVTPGHQQKHVFMPKDGETISALLEAYREVTGDMSEPLVIGGGTYARGMDNIVAFGPVYPGMEPVEHQANEYIGIEHMHELRKIYRKAFENLLK